MKRPSNLLFLMTAVILMSGVSALWMLAPGEAGRAFAAEAVAPTPSPSPGAEGLDTDFLLLPSHDLEPVAAATASPTPSSYQVGDQIALQASGIELPPGSALPLSVELPPGNAPLMDQGWELLPASSKAGQAGADLRITAVPLKPGKLTLPSLAIQDAAGKKIARTNPFNLNVQSAIQPNDPEPQKPADLRPPAELAYPWWVVITIGVIAVLLVAAAVYGLYRWSTKDRAKLPKPAEPPKPEDEVALAAFAQLEKSGELASGDYKRHYFKVSEILKTYIGARYGFDAPESTTQEMLRTLERSMASELNADMSQLAALIELFEQLDRVKFTDHIPSQQEARSTIPIAREFVQKTRRRPTVLSSSSSGGPEVTMGGGGQNAPR